MSRSGYQSFLEIQLRPWKSMQSQREPSFFLNKEDWSSMGSERDRLTLEQGSHQ